MLTGIDYAHSQEKRDFDKYALRYIRPFAMIAKGLLVLNGETDVEFLQTRIGHDGKPFEVHKLRTLKEDALTPTGRTAAFLRRSGMDELIQYRNVVDGDMSVVGRRPLTPAEYEEAFDDVPGDVVDDYQRIVVPTRPGLVGSFVIAAHLGDIKDHAMRLKRLEMEIQDVIDGSRERDKQLFWSAVTKGLTNKMQRGDIRPREVL